jgi:hypothetical protein
MASVYLLISFRIYAQFGLKQSFAFVTYSHKYNLLVTEQAWKLVHLGHDFKKDNQHLKFILPESSL